VRVVIVEDSLELAKILHSVISMYVNDVTYATEIETALDLVAAPTDILVCDLSLGRGRGECVIEAALAAHRATAVIVCSGGALNLSAFKERASQFFLLPKPFSNHELRWALYRARTFAEATHTNQNRQSESV